MSLVIGIPARSSAHDKVHEYCKANNLTATYAPWHPSPEYRIFATDGDNLYKYPSGLVISTLVGQDVVQIPYDPRS